MTKEPCTVPDCTEPMRTRKMCGAHYQRWRAHGDPLAGGPSRPRGTLAERFWAKVDKSGPVPEHTPELGPCWVWTSTLSSSGYGLIYSPTGSRRATHVALELAGTNVPDEMFVLHRCDNPPCVRAEHLFVGTQSDNMRDKFSKGRANHVRGADHPFAKLTEACVREMRALHALGVSTAECARRFGVDHKTARHAIERISWKHVA